MARFLLVHGAWHGAWCWSRLSEILQRRGHEVEAIDLPGVGEAPERVGVVSLDDCARAIVAAAGSQPAWLVGHSLGGAAITAAAAMRPELFQALVYVAASAPLAGETHLQTLSLGPPGRAVPRMAIDAERKVAGLERQDRLAAFYNRCSPSVAQEAVAAGATWQALGPAVDPLRADPPAEMARFYVRCSRDETIPLETQAAMCGRLAWADTATLDTDHSPFLSDPEGLATTLDRFATSGRKCRAA